MAGEYFRLGDLDCLQGQNVPQQLGDIESRMTYPGYQDSRYNGFGLQTPDMSLEVHESLFQNNSALSNIRKKILNRVGVWQIECPEFRRENVNSATPFIRIPVCWHSDYGTIHRMIGCDVSCKKAYGETVVTTQQVFLLDIYGNNSSNIARIHAYIESIRVGMNQVYSPLTTNMIVQAASELASNISFETIQRDVTSRPDSVVRHFYHTNDPNRPSNIEPYSTLAWDDRTMVHAAPNASGTILSRSFQV